MGFDTSSILLRVGCMTTFYWFVGLIIAVFIVIAYFGDRWFPIIDDVIDDDFGC